MCVQEGFTSGSDEGSGPPVRVLLASTIGTFDQIVRRATVAQDLLRLGIDEQRFRGLGAAVDAKKGAAGQRAPVSKSKTS